MTDAQPTPPVSNIEPVNLKSAQVAAGFDWGVYANVTMAGLAVLVPIPILDWLVVIYLSVIADQGSLYVDQADFQENPLLLNN